MNRIKNWAKANKYTLTMYGVSFVIGNLVGVVYELGYKQAEKELEENK